MAASATQPTSQLSNSSPTDWMEHNPAMMTLVDLESQEILHVNQTFLSTLGYERSDVIGKPTQDLNIYYDTHLKRQFDEQIQQGKAMLRVEMPMRTQTGRRLDCLFTLQRIHFDGKHCVLTSALDISRFRRAEIFLKHKTEQQALLAEIAHRLLDIDHLKNNLEQILRKLGEYLGVSRIYIFEEDPSREGASNTHEWCNLGIRPQKDNLQAVPYAMVPSWYETLKKNGMLFSPDIRDLPTDIRTILEPQGIKSILVYELQILQRFHGFIGYDECAQKREWIEDDIEFLRILSGLISTAFERRAYQHMLANRAQR